MTDSVLLGSLHNYRLLLLEHGFGEPAPGGNGEGRRLSVIGHTIAGWGAGMSKSVIVGHRYEPAHVLVAELLAMVTRRDASPQRVSPGLLASFGRGPGSVRIISSQLVLFLDQRIRTPHRATQGQTSTSARTHGPLALHFDPGNRRTLTANQEAVLRSNRLRQAGRSRARSTRTVARVRGESRVQVVRPSATTLGRSIKSVS